MPCILAVEPKVLATTVYHLELIVLVYYLLSANFTVVYSRAFPVFSYLGVIFLLCCVVAGGVSMSVGAVWGQRCQGQKLQLGLGLCGGSFLYRLTR